MEDIIHDEHSHKKILNRLKRARGQLDAVIKIIEDKPHDCKQIVMQLSAVSNAVDKAAFIVIVEAMKECLVDDHLGEDKKALAIKELEKMFVSIA